MASVFNDFMYRDYDIFERFPDGKVFWRETVVGREESLRRLRDFFSASDNELFAMYIPTKEVIATLSKKK